MTCPGMTIPGLHYPIINPRGKIAILYRFIDPNSSGMYLQYPIFSLQLNSVQRFLNSIPLYEFGKLCSKSFKIPHSISSSSMHEVFFQVTYSLNQAHT